MSVYNECLLINWLTEKYIFFLLLHNKKYLVREKGTREFAQLGETVKIGCSEMNTFTVVYIPFISSNIPASPTYGFYISQLIRYSRACAQYSDCLNRAHLLTQKLPKQGYVAPRLKSSLQKLYGRHHDLVDRYEISIPQMTITFYVDYFLLLSLPRLPIGHDCIYEYNTCVL